MIVRPCIPCITYTQTCYNVLSVALAQCKLLLLLSIYIQWCVPNWNNYVIILTQTVFSVHGGNKLSIADTPAGGYSNPVTTLQTLEWESITHWAGVSEAGGINVELYTRPHCWSYCLRAHYQIDCFTRTSVIEDNQSRYEYTSATISNSEVEPRLIGNESKLFSGCCGSSRCLSCQGSYECIITSVYSSHWIHCRGLILQ